MRYSYLSILLFGLIAFSCGEDGNPEPGPNTTGSSSFEVSGIEPGSFNYGAEFTGVVSSAGDGLSSYQIGMGNYGTTNTALVITLGELGNKQGISAGTYNYTSDTNANLQLWAIYVTDNNSYQISSTSGDINRLVITSISDTVIKGTFEFNLEINGDGDKIMITGSFEAVGETLKS